MQLNKLLKSLAVALPMMTLAACSSTKGTSSDAQMTDAAKDQVVETEAVEQIELSPEELLAQKYGQAILENTINFGYDKSDIMPEYRTVLNAHAKYLVANAKLAVTIEGHTDERGTPEYNIALGERRANAVVRYLQSMGVPSSQLETVSYGEEKPANPAHTQAAQAENRRAVLVY